MQENRKPRKTFYLFVLTVLVIALATPLGAYAQVEEEASSEEMPQEEVVAVSEQAEAEPGPDQLVSSVTGINEEIAALKRTPELDVDRVQVVNVENVLEEGGEGIEAFQDAVDLNNIKIWALQNVLSKQEAVVDVLASSEVPLENVVAAHMAGEGALIVFYQSSPIASEARSSIRGGVREL